MASRIGHGALGLRSALMDFDAFAGQTYSRKQAFLELQGGMRSGTWSGFGESLAFVTDLAEVWDGVLLDVVGVITMDEVLTRVETLDLCIDTEGTYFYDYAAGGPLYVRLTGDYDPTDRVVVPLFGFYFGTRGSVEPILSDDKFTDGGLEDWLTPLGLNQWEPVDIGGAAQVSVNRDASDFQEGRYSARLEVDTALPADDGGGFQQGGMVGVEGAHYIVSGRYKTSFRGVTSLGTEARIRVTADGTNYLMEDGATTETSDLGFALLPTSGEWRRFLYAYRCPSDSSGVGVRVSFLLHNNSGSELGEGHTVHFDDVHHYRVWRYAYFEPRLSGDGLPDLQRTANDLWFGSESLGLGNVRILNRDDTRDTVPYLETLLGRYEVCSRSISLRYGGALMSGQEIPYDNTEPGWTGVVQGFEVGALAAEIQVASVRGILNAELPLSLWNAIDSPDLAEADNGRPKQLLFGTLGNVRPARLAFELEELGGLGNYQTQDPAFAPGDITMPSAVYVYEDEDAAAIKDPARRILLLDGIDYESDSYETTARFRLLLNPGPVRIVAGENDSIDFAVDAGPPLQAFLNPGLHKWADLLAHIAGVLDAVASLSGFAVSYDLADHHVQIDGEPAGATTITLYTDTGANKERSAFATLGFSQTADLTGSPAYESETEIAHDPDVVVLRCDCTGPNDDAAGTYTGTPGALIQLGPDISRVILRKILHVANPTITNARFDEGRTTSPQLLGVCIGGLASVQGGAGSLATLQEVLDRIEISCYADISVDNAGRWDWVPRIDDLEGYAATIATVLANSDFLEFSGVKTLEDVYYISRLNYGQDPSTGIVRSVEFVNATVPVLYDRRNSRTWDSYLLDDADAQDMITKLARAAGFPVNRYNFVVKGRMLRNRLGDIVDVSARFRKLAEPDAQAEPYLIRLTSLSVNPLTHIAQASGYTQFFGVVI